MNKNRTLNGMRIFTLLAFLFLGYFSTTAQTIYGLSNNRLYVFNAATPDAVTLVDSIRGITAGQRIVGLDFRPNTGELFGLGYNPATGASRLYIINIQTAVATPVGMTTFTLSLGMGANVGFDFNPTVDRIRVTSGTGTNFRLNPITGGIAATDSTLRFNPLDSNANRTPLITASGYTNSFIGAGTTTLFNIDAGLGILVTQVPPNDGVLNTIGSLGITFPTNAIGDLDIAFNPTTSTNTAYLVVNSVTGGRSILYTVNLMTGRATAVDTLGTRIVGALEDIAVQIERATVPQNVQGTLLYAVTTNNNLITFDSRNPSLIRSSVGITGIAVGQTLVGTDFRPNTGELFGLGYNSTNGESRLYTINLQTGVATAVGMATFTLNLGTTPIGFDFNPTVDRIRVEGANRQNFRLNPVTGGIAATDSTLRYAAMDVNAARTPAIGSVAYTNSFIGSTATTLYAYDDVLNVLSIQNPPNDGVLNTVGTSGITVSTTDVTSDFDIALDSAGNNVAFFVANTTSTNDSLYTLNLTTGRLTGVGRIGNGIPVRDIAAFIARVDTTRAVQGQLAYALTANNLLLRFDTRNPSLIRRSTAVTGLTAGQTIVGLDFRPATGELWALGYNRTNGQATLYTLDTTTAVLTSRTPTPITLDLGTGAVGFDFNPTVDRIRLVGENRRNYRLNPLTGGIAATDSTLRFAAADRNAGATPRIGAIAYTNSFRTATTTTLYDYDLGLNILTTQAPPNDGVLNTVGASGVSVNAMDLTIDLDIFSDSVARTNIAYLVANSGTSRNDSLYTVDLATGRATVVGRIGSGSQIINIAIPIQVRGGTTPVDTTNRGNFRFQLVTSSGTVLLDSIRNNDTINVRNFNVNRFNIRATPTTSVGSIRFVLSGPISVNRVENNAPYHLFGDIGRIVNFARQLPVGTYTLTATPFSQSRGGGTAGAVQTLRFTVIDRQRLQEPNESFLVQKGRVNAPVAAEGLSLSAYPNPAKDWANVRFEGATKGLMLTRIVDQNGRIVKSMQLMKDDVSVDYRIDLSGLATGIYHIQVVMGDTVSNVRVVITE